MDSAIAGAGGVGSFADPFKTYAQWSVQAAGSEIYFRGSGTAITPRQYIGGGTLTGKNFLLKNYLNEHVELLDTSRTQAFIFTDWTGGSVIRQGTGSFKFGACAPPASLTDGGWSNCSLLLNGVTNFLIDGGQDTSGSQTSRACGVIVDSGSDQGIRIAKNGAHGSATGGSQNIEIRGLEGTGTGTAIFLTNPSNSNRLPATNPTGVGINIHHCWFHHNDRMGVKGSGGGDTGGVGVGYERAWGTSANPMLLHDNLFNNNAADDSNPGDYGQDGGAFETFGAGYLYAYNNIMYDNAGGFESGTGSTSPLSSNLHLHHNLLYGLSNGIPGPGGTPHSSPAFLFRDAADSTFHHNTVDLGTNPSNAFAMSVYTDTGQYGGSVARFKAFNNIFIQRNSYRLHYIADLPAGADKPVFNYDIVIRTGTLGTGISDWRVGGTVGTYDWAQWQAQGFETNGQNIAIASADGIFADRPARNYTLISSSPARNVGVLIPGINDGFQGAGPDLGAFEFAEGAPSAAYAQDTFTRSVTNGLGTAEVGGAWTTSQGAPGDYGVNGNAATVSIATGTGREMRLNSVQQLDVTGTGRVRCPVVLAGSAGLGLTAGTFARRSSDGLQSYRFYVKFLTGGALAAYVARRSGGSEVAIGAQITPANLTTYTANQWVRYRYECRNLSAGVATLRMRVWADGASEPGTWDIDTTDSTASNQIVGAYAQWHYYDAGISSGTIVTQWDDIGVTSPSLNGAVVPAIISVTTQVFSPTLVKGTVVLTPPRITQASAPIAFSQIKQTITGPPRINLSSAVMTPTASAGTASVTPGVIAQTGAVMAFALTVRFSVAVVATTPLVFSPTLNLGLSVGLIDVASAVLSPIVGQYVNVGLIALSPTVSAPTLGLQVSIPLINREAVVYGPVTGQYTAPGLLDYTATISAPVLVATSAVSVGLVDQSAVMFAPDVLPGTFEVVVGLIAQDIGLFAPVLTDTLPFGVGLIDSTAVLFDPGFLLTFEVGYIEQPAILFDPQLNFGLAFPLLSATATLFQPDVGANVLSGRAPVIVSAGIYARF